MTTPEPEPGLLVAWAVTYRCHDPGGQPATVTETLDATWCQSAGYQPADVRDPIRAAWSLALLLGAHGNEDAELVTIEAAP